ncbi:MAG TPA: hypothetical protein PLI09_20835 [Candidatus Hydrogenedentes bacterium]|nr:hypothetical protein [Candidatus Hydrogenedentota bacterium]
MGRIAAPITIANLNTPEKTIRCDALVNTGASHLTLPTAWRDRLGDLLELRTVQLETATQKTVEGLVCGPVHVQLEGFPPIITEVLFIEMEPENGQYEALIGYIVLEQSQAAVDMFGHRLVHIKRLDLK